MATVSERVYSELPSQPKEVIKAFDLNKAVPTDFSDTYLERYVSSDYVDRKQHLLGYSAFVLDPCRPPNKLPKLKKKFKKLTSKERRRLQLHSVPTTGLKYTEFYKLHQLWLDYTREILNFDEPSFGSRFKQIEESLLRCDYHGCEIKVTQSKCPTYVGLCGIIIQDTKETFKIITKHDRVKIVPKKNSIFTFKLGEYELKIYGSNFNFRPMDRINRKFKGTNSIDL